MKAPMRFAKYNLNFPNLCNGQATVVNRTGVIVEYEGGYGCIQSWPELGDDPLESHLEALQQGKPTEMGQACLNCCKIDGQARRNRINLISKILVRPSHRLITNINSIEVITGKLRTLNQGDLIKIKGTSNLDETLEAVECIAQSFRIRIDFNACLTLPRFRQFLGGLTDHARRQIEFIEDPFPYDADQWMEVSLEFDVRLALDWGSADALAGFAVRIWKPARQLNPPAGNLYCITHNMDHGIGRAYATYQASLFKGDLLACGLGDISPCEEDIGLGYSKELELLEWETL